MKLLHLGCCVNGPVVWNGDGVAPRSEQRAMYVRTMSKNVELLDQVKCFPSCFVLELLKKIGFEINWQTYKANIT